MSRQWLYRLCAEHTLEIVASAITYIIARWLLEMSTPEEDWYEVRRWWPFPALRWYRGPEYLHQLRGMRLLREALS